MVSADNGNDPNLDKLDSASIKAGDDDDTISASDRTNSSTIFGGAGADSVDFTGKSTDSLIKLGDDNDINTTDAGASVKHTNLKIKGNQGDDSITIDDEVTGKNIAIYGGKGDDPVLNNTASVLVSGDAGDDRIIVDGNSSGATLLGADGDDVIDNDDADGSSSFFIKLGKGDDSINGSTGKDTVYGGQGDDTTGDGDGQNVAVSYNGDKGDDELLDTTVASAITGGSGDDDITSEAVSTETGKAHTLIGGSGEHPHCYWRRCSCYRQ